MTCLNMPHMLAHHQALVKCRARAGLRSSPCHCVRANRADNESQWNMRQPDNLCRGTSMRLATANRRQFLHRAGAVAAAGMVGGSLPAAARGKQAGAIRLGGRRSTPPSIPMSRPRLIAGWATGPPIAPGWISRTRRGFATSSGLLPGTMSSSRRSAAGSTCSMPTPRNGPPISEL